jgi:uncharacterized protein (TIGR02246 family)
MSQSDEHQILQLFEDGDRALIAADVAEMRRIYAEDYTQADESGTIATRQEVIERLTSGNVRFISMKSLSRRIRFLRGDVAIVNGAEEDEIEQEGRRSTVGYIYMDVVIKREGRWRIAASQLAEASAPRA